MKIDLFVCILHRLFLSRTSNIDGDTRKVAMVELEPRTDYHTYFRSSAYDFTRHVQYDSMYYNLFPDLFLRLM